MADTEEGPARRISRCPVTRLLPGCDSRADIGGPQGAGVPPLRAKKLSIASVGRQQRARRRLVITK